MKSVKTSEMRKINGGCIPVRCPACGDKMRVYGLLSGWAAFKHTLFCYAAKSQTNTAE